MARAPLIPALVVGLTLLATAAYAEYPVIDTTAIAKAIEQLKELKAQAATQLQQLGELKQSVAFLTDISKFTKEVQDAVGKIANITLPITNLQKVAAQTKSNLRCLMPETSLKWGVKFDDLNLGSICETSSVYREALFADPDSLRSLSYAEREQRRVEVRHRRTALLEDATSRALAQADIQLKQADELNNATDQLQSDLAGAQTLQDRAHVEAQIGLAQLRGQAQQNQLLAQLLKVQSALAIALGLPAEAVAEITEGGSQ